VVGLLFVGVGVVTTGAEVVTAGAGVVSCRCCGCYSLVLELLFSQ